MEVSETISLIATPATLIGLFALAWRVYHAVTKAVGPVRDEARQDREAMRQEVRDDMKETRVCPDQSRHLESRPAA